MTVLSPSASAVSGECEGGAAEITLSVHESREFELAIGKALVGDYAIYNDKGLPLAFVSQNHMKIKLPLGEYVIKRIKHN